MATITERENGTYLVRVFCGRDNCGKQIFKSRTFRPSKRNLPYHKLTNELNHFVKTFEDELREMAINNEFKRNDDPSKMPFAAFCKEFINIKKDTLSPNTLPFYCRVIDKHLIPRYGKMRLEEFKVYHIQEYVSFLCNMDREDGYVGKIAPQTVRRYATVLRSILSLAYKMEYIDNDISLSRRLHFPSSTTAEVEVYSFEEVQHILKELESEPINIRAMIETAIFTGCRRAEIVGLKWSDIDFETRTLHVKRSIYKIAGEKAQEKTPKSKNGIRTMSIPQRLCYTLLEYKAYQDSYKAFFEDEWHELDYIFTEATGLVMNPQTPTKQFSKFLKRHNIRQIKFHGLRHTSATLLLASGCDIKTVSQRLGHADIDTTGIYVHALEKCDKTAAETFDKL
jgi:integrase